jgi:ribosome maturation factor RimP
MDRQALEDALRETLHDHGLRLVEVTWKKNLEKRTLALGLKVTGDLDEQLKLLESAAR